MPSEAEPQCLLARELARMKRRPAHLSSAPTLTGLAAGHMVYEPEKGRRAWLPLVPDLGFARRWASGPAATQAALRRLGAGSDARWPRDERRAWERLAPVVLALPGIDTWSAKDKREALAALRAKGGVREIDFLRCVDAHAPLTTALQRLLGAWRRSS